MILDTKLICPKCGCESPLKTFQVTEEILELARLAAKFGKSWPWLEEYLHCFQSSPDRPLKPAKMKMILEEFLRFIDQAGFNIDKQWYPVRSDALFLAARHVALTNKTGFKNHNYLKKVAIDFNFKMVQKDEKEQTKKVEEALRRDPEAPRKLREFIKKLE